MKTLKISALAVAIGLLTSCNKPAEQAASTFDIEKVKAAIGEEQQKFTDALFKADSVAYSMVIHSQGIVFPPNMEPITGREKLVSFAYHSFKAGVGGVALQTTEIWGNPDVVIATGTYDLKGKDGSTIDKGKYIEVWKDDNGQWKLYRDMWNSSMPMQMPSAPASKK
jgi:ketosteroid isomerase-like protein